jgi:MFS family permease
VYRNQARGFHFVAGCIRAFNATNRGTHIMDKKRIAVIFLIVLTNAMAATAILPMLPIYVEGQFHATPVQAMLVIAAYYASQFVAAPILGKLSDRFGRRPILIASQIGTIGSYSLLINWANPSGLFSD